MSLKSAEDAREPTACWDEAKIFTLQEVPDLLIKYGKLVEDGGVVAEVSGVKILANDRAVEQEVDGIVYRSTRDAEGNWSPWHKRAVSDRLTPTEPQPPSDRLTPAAEVPSVESYGNFAAIPVETVYCTPGGQFTIRGPKTDGHLPAASDRAFDTLEEAVEAGGQLLEPGAEPRTPLEKRKALCTKLVDMGNALQSPRQRPEPGKPKTKKQEAWDRFHALQAKHEQQGQMSLKRRAKEAYALRGTGKPLWQDVLAKFEFIAQERLDSGTETLADFLMAVCEELGDVTASNLPYLLEAWKNVAPATAKAMERAIRHEPAADAELHVTSKERRVSTAFFPMTAEQAKEVQVAAAEVLGLPVEVRNSIGMKLRLIPAGEFLMGSPESEEGRLSDEGPQHWVRITKPFYLGMHEVTQEQYEWVMNRNPSHFSVTGCPDQISDWDTRRLPVEEVDWNEAVEFCQKLSTLPSEHSAGRSYRLPTEAEWEYACRAGTATPFHFGSELNGREANCDGDHPYGTSEKGPRLHQPTKVGSYGANGFGLYDMHGNVWEWCEDWFDENYYANSPVDDPPEPASGSDCVCRGGSFADDEAGVCRSAMRGRSDPEDRYYDKGFRVVLFPVKESWSLSQVRFLPTVCVSNLSITEPDDPDDYELGQESAVGGILNKMYWNAERDESMLPFEDVVWFFRGHFGEEATRRLAPYILSVWSDYQGLVGPAGDIDAILQQYANWKRHDEPQENWVVDIPEGEMHPVDEYNLRDMTPKERLEWAEQYLNDNPELVNQVVKMLDERPREFGSEEYFPDVSDLPRALLRQYEVESKTSLVED